MFHEGKSIDAVIRHIEKRDGGQRGSDLYSPDEQGHSVPIDYAGSIGGRYFAFEHTGIEAYPGQIELDKQRRNLFDPVQQRFAGKLSPPACFELHVPHDATTGIKNSKIAGIQEELVKWVEANADSAPSSPYGSYSKPIRQAPTSGIPFQLELFRFNEAYAMAGQFVVRPVYEGDLEAERLSRIHKSCKDKFANLARWKEEKDAYTILILEDADISLTNHQRIMDTLAQAEKDYGSRPDEIYAVSTYLESPWWVSCLRREGKTYYDDGERLLEVDPASLSQLTKR